MRHLNRVAKLNKSKSHRKALLQNLANALFDHERITTTSTRAMELKKVADRLITLAKRKDQHAMRLVFSMLRDKEIVKKLFADIVDRYSAINGGYTRVLKIGNRKGDNAPMAMIELTQRKEKAGKKEKEKSKETKETKKEVETKEKPNTKKEAREKKETKAKKEPKAKTETKTKKEPKAKKEAKTENTETQETKEKKRRKKGEGTK
jgi:large subunit ribosomal protein L17